jgi:hypothetical protein
MSYAFKRAPRDVQYRVTSSVRGVLFRTDKKQLMLTKNSGTNFLCQSEVISNQFRFLTLKNKILISKIVIIFKLYQAFK